MTTTHLDTTCAAVGLGVADQVVVRGGRCLIDRTSSGCCPTGIFSSRCQLACHAQSTCRHGTHAGFIDFRSRPLAVVATATWFEAAGCRPRPCLPMRHPRPGLWRSRPPDDPPGERRMIGYVTLGTNDLPRAIAFYDALLAEIGIKRLMDYAAAMAWGVSMTGPRWAW